MERVLRRRNLDHPLVTAALALFLVGGFVGVRLSHREWNPASFVAAGDRFTDPARVAAGVPVAKESHGYDGQFYYGLALDPWPGKTGRFGVTLDAPAKRHQRIGYPVAARVLAAGRQRLVPAALIAVNLLCIALCGYQGGKLAQEGGRHALWGSLVPLYPGFLFTISFESPPSAW